MSNTSEDQVLEGFFAEMRKKDLGLALPAPPIPKKSPSWRWFPMGIAASLLLLLWFLGEKDTNYSMPQDIIIITLEEGPDHEVNFSIEQTSAMEIWEPPTSSLLTEF